MFQLMIQSCKKMLDSEIKHSSPTEKLCYEVGTLDRWMALVGGGSHILRQNDAKDWSLLTPLGRITSEVVVDDHYALPLGSLVVPLTMTADGYEVFRPSPDFPVSPLFREGETVSVVRSSV